MRPHSSSRSSAYPRTRSVRDILPCACIISAVLALAFSCVGVDPASAPTPTPAGDPVPPEDDAVWSIAFDTARTGALSSVWGSAPDDVFVVGGRPVQGEIYHYDGEAWAQMAAPPVPLLVWVFGFGPHDVFAVGVDGGAVHYDGATWTRLDTGTTEDLWGIWGTAPDDLWIVGGTVGLGEPVLLHFDGATFAPVSVPPNDRAATSLFKVWGIDGKVVAVGESGLIIERASGSWSQAPAGANANQDFVSAWGTSAGNIVAVGGRSNGQIAVFDGAGWSTFKPTGLPGLNGVFMDDPGFAIIGGAGGWVGRYVVGSDTPIQETAPTTDDLHAVWGDGAGSYYAVGGSFSSPYTGRALVRTLGDPGIVPVPPIPISETCIVDADCADESPCTIDTCNAGDCLHTPMDCSDDDPCTADVCIDGACMHPALVCNDNDPCTVDACVNGACTFTALDCDDNNACTFDGCSGGTCTYANACAAGQVCMNGACVDAPQCTTVAECDDGDACTIEECVSNTCVFTPLSCNDGDLCTTDTCVDGDCVFNPRVCDDNNPCTIDACVGGACTFTPIPDCACSAETDCVLGENCVDGACQLAGGPDLEIGVAVGVPPFVGLTPPGCVTSEYEPLTEGGELPVCQGFQGWTEFWLTFRTMGFTPGAQLNVTQSVVFEDESCSGEDDCAPEDFCVSGSCNLVNVLTRECPQPSPSVTCAASDLGAGITEYVNFGSFSFDAVTTIADREVLLTLEVSEVSDPGKTATAAVRVTLYPIFICGEGGACPAGHTCASNYFCNPD